MRCAAFCILLLAISEPLLIHAKKLVVIVPRQIRRSPVAPWRSSPAPYKKSGPGGSYYHGYNSPPGHYHAKKPMYRNPPFPHGGDDFDQGHESVNHVHIPYGKDVIHATTFGKGYVPYDNIKGSFSFGRERYTGGQGYNHPEQEYAPTSFTSVGSEYPPSGFSYEPSSTDSFFSDNEGSTDYRERRNDPRKYYSPRSLEKELSSKPQVNFNNAIIRENEQFLQQKGAEFYNGVSPQAHEIQSAISLPAGVPPATIGGSKAGVVFRDSVSLDEYQRKLQELTKTWPQLLTAGSADQNAGYQQQQANVTPGFPAAGLPGSGFTGSTGWLADFAQPKRSYAVKEDTMEAQHDFRNMPLQTAPFQNLPRGINIGLTPIAQAAHG